MKQSFRCAAISENLLNCFKEQGVLDLYVHSVFAHALNLIYKSDLITVLSAGRDMFPLSMLLADDVLFDTLGLSQGQRCELNFTDKEIDAETESFSFSDAAVYDCNVLDISEKPVLWNIIENRCRDVKGFVLENGSKDGLLPLLSTDRSMESNMWCEFLASRINDLCNTLSEVFENNLSAEKEIVLKEEFAKITGAGPGLTPSGDDFITGALSAVFCLAAYGFISKDVAFGIGNCASANENKTNHISGSFIKQASLGLLSYGMIQAAKSLFEDGFSKETLFRNIKTVLDFGSSSGTDILTGFLFALSAYKE